MLKIQQTTISEGFGDGSGYSQGEYLHSEGMQKTQNGITPNWGISSSVDNGTLTDLNSPLQFFTQAAPGGTSATYGTDNNGGIFKWDGVNWTLAYKPIVASSGNGLIGDQKGNLLYKTSRYLGKYDGTADYTTGTIAVTNGSAAVIGTGTTFTSGMVNRRIVINGVWYTVQTFTDATHITLSTNYTGSTASGLSYAIKIGWNDQFQDFTTDVSNTFCPLETYEDTVLIAHGSQIGTYNVQTNTFAAAAFTVPSNCTIRTIKSGRNGIHITGNLGNRSFRLLWDNQSTRSISPWIWSDENTLSVAPWNGNWIVTTNRRLLLSTGYYENELVPIPDSTANGSYLSCFTQGSAVVGNYFFLANSANLTNRVKSGVSILNLRNLKWEYCPTASSINMNNTMGAIFFDSAGTLHLSWRTQNPSKIYIGNVSNGTPTRAVVISAPVGAGNSLKTAQGVRLSLAMNPMATDSRNFSFNIAVKVSNLRRILWGFAQPKIDGTSLNQITVNGTLTGLNDAQVGDEIRVMEGVDAGQTAHIISISGQNSSTEIWTLDTNLTNNIETGVFIQVMPFRLLSKQTISNVSQLRDLLFTAKNQIQGRKFLLKIVIDNISGIPPELNKLIDFIYDDLGDI